MERGGIPVVDMSIAAVLLFPRIGLRVQRRLPHSGYQYRSVWEIQVQIILDMTVPVGPGESETKTA